MSLIDFIKSFCPFYRRRGIADTSLLESLKIASRSRTQCHKMTKNLMSKQGTKVKVKTTNRMGPHTNGNSERSAWGRLPGMKLPKQGRRRESRWCKSQAGAPNGDTQPGWAAGTASNNGLARSARALPHAPRPLAIPPLQHAARLARSPSAPASPWLPKGQAAGLLIVRLPKPNSRARGSSPAAQAQTRSGRGRRGGADPSRHWLPVWGGGPSRLGLQVRRRRGPGGRAAHGEGGRTHRMPREVERSNAETTLGGRWEGGPQDKELKNEGNGRERRDKGKSVSHHWLQRKIPFSACLSSRSAAV